MNLEAALAVLIIGFFVVITPGPNMAVVIKNTLSGNSLSGIATSLGLLLGNLIHITYCLIGIGLVISQSIVLFNVIRILGALYLIYLGIRALKTKKTPTEEAESDPAHRKSHFRAFLNGLLTDLLNPKATLFFLALFTQIIRPEYSTLEKIFSGFSVAFLELVCFSILALIIGHPAVKKGIRKISHWIEKVTGAILVLLGIRIIFSGDSR